MKESMKNKETEDSERVLKLQNLQADTLSILKRLKSLEKIDVSKMSMSLSSVSKELNNLIIKEITGDLEDD